MCITAPARVLSADAGMAVVEIGDRRRRASTLLVPDIAAGEWVLVGAGSILRRLEPAEAHALAAAIDSAIEMTDRAQPAASPHHAGGSR